MPATYRLGDLRQRANLLHHEILQDEVGLRTLTDRLNAVAGMPDAKRKVEQRLATNRPRLAAMESEIRRLEAEELADRMVRESSTCARCHQPQPNVRYVSGQGNLCFGCSPPRGGSEGIPGIPRRYR